jgi:hypothetical protein
MRILLDYLSSSLELQVPIFCLVIRTQLQIKLHRLFSLSFPRALQVILELAKFRVKKLHILLLAV